MCVKEKCKTCGGEYDPKEIKRIFGFESSVLKGGYCSSKCYTINAVGGIEKYKKIKSRYKLEYDKK